MFHKMEDSGLTAAVWKCLLLHNKICISCQLKWLDGLIWEQTCTWSLLYLLQAPHIHIYGISPLAEWWKQCLPSELEQPWCNLFWLPSFFIKPAYITYIYVVWTSWQCKGLWWMSYTDPNIWSHHCSQYLCCDPLEQDALWALWYNIKMLICWVAPLHYTWYNIRMTQWLQLYRKRKAHQCNRRTQNTHLRGSIWERQDLYKAEMLSSMHMLVQLLASIHASLIFSAPIAATAIQPGSPACYGTVCLIVEHL